MYLEHPAGQYLPRAGLDVLLEAVKVAVKGTSLLHGHCVMESPGVTGDRVVVRCPGNQPASTFQDTPPSTPTLFFRTYIHNKHTRVKNIEPRIVKMEKNVEASRGDLLVSFRLKFAVTSERKK